MSEDNEQPTIIDVDVSPAEELADVLDELLQHVAEMTPGGLKRVSTKEKAANAAERQRLLMAEAQASIKMLKQKNARAAGCESSHVRWCGEPGPSPNPATRSVYVGRTPAKLDRQHASDLAWLV